MANDKDQIHLEVGRALNVVTASLGYKTFEMIHREYKDVEEKFIAICDDSDLQLYIRQNVSERIFGDAVAKNCASNDLEYYYSAAAELGFSDVNPRISSTILYCQSLILNDRSDKAKRLLEDLLNYLTKIEEANPGVFPQDTFDFLGSQLSKCE
ncbi:MAG: hypothetical protein IH984_04635 [Planctomycetes bacterium]|nr:hypothetical protein [Planctomycetota bacterium]